MAQVTFWIVTKLGKTVRITKIVFVTLILKRSSGGRRINGHVTNGVYYLGTVQYLFADIQFQPRS